MNDYGVFKTNDDGTETWVTAVSPDTQLGSITDAIDDWSYAEAITVAGYLNGSNEVTFAPGRPKDRQPK